MIKKFSYVFAALIFIFCVLYVIKASDKISLLQSFLPEKLAVFKNVHMSGIQASNEAWEVYAKEGWTGRDKFATTLEYVTFAKIERNGRPIVNGIRARRMRIAKNKDIEIFKQAQDEKDGKSYLSVMIDFGALSSPPKLEKKFSYLTADHLKFNPDSKIGSVQGNIYIKKDKLVIRSERLTLDLDANIASFESRSSFQKEGSRLYADNATAFFDEDRIDMKGSVEVVQKNKNAYSDAAVYNDKSRNIEMMQNVRAEIEKPKSLLKEASAGKYKSEEAQKALLTKTIITCNKLIVNTDNNDCSAFGNVYVTQKEKQARSDQAIYSQDNEKIIMTGNVYMKKNDDWVKADKAIVSVDKEIFEAIGGAETTFKVKKGSKR